MADYRLFIAIELPETAKMALLKIQQQFPPLKAVRWTKPQNIHLTLQFLGDFPTARVEKLTEALKLVSSHPAFEMKFSGLGTFPNQKRPRIIWAGVDDSSKLQTLQQAVITATAKIGIPAETKPFTPHLTIGRVKKWARKNDFRAIANAVQNASPNHIAAFHVNAVHLIRSQLTREGPIYTTLNTIQLNQTAPTPR